MGYLSCLQRVPDLERQDYPMCNKGQCETLNNTLTYSQKGFEMTDKAIFNCLSVSEWWVMRVEGVQEKNHWRVERSEQESVLQLR